MTKPEINPRMDDGVWWCDAGCEHGFVFHKARFCKLIAKAHPDLDGNICPVWAKRMAVECEAWRSGRLYCCGGLVGLNGRGPLTITGAVGALMAEKGEE